MSAEQNKAIARRWVEERWGQGDLVLIDENVSPDFVSNSPTPTLEALKQGIRNLHANYTDIRVTIKEQIAEGDKGVNRLRWEGAHQGSEVGM